MISVTASASAPCRRRGSAISAHGAAEFITGFVGEADLGEAGGVHGLDAEDEDIRAIVVPVERALAAVASGEVNNAPLLISLYWLERHRARLTTAWADE